MVNYTFFVPLNEWTVKTLSKKIVHHDHKKYIFSLSRFYDQSDTAATQSLPPFLQPPIVQFFLLLLSLKTSFVSTKALPVRVDLLRELRRFTKFLISYQRCSLYRALVRTGSRGLLNPSILKMCLFEPTTFCTIYDFGIIH